MLYEETLYSRWIIVLLVPPLVAMATGLYLSVSHGEGVEIMAIAMGLTVAVVLEVMAIRIRIYEDRILITGYLGFMIRKTVRLGEIEWFAVREGWMRCYGTIHFTLPARGCVVLRQKKGRTVSFTTNNPDEVARVLVSLGVPRGA
ncbi:hypothetical protein [Thermococcus sp.]|uniref:hypothetical protein n=1 Tax=Thermococcus sp. TaxID=35749 RepID=UPI0026290526|nr:hypothetical protein [Thermococcus sp.]